MAVPLMAGRYKQDGTKSLHAGLKLATKDQLWRLNEQGGIALTADDRAFTLGAGPVNDPILNAQADTTLHRYLHERWHGLGHWPAPGEAWTVRNGLVVPLASVLEEDS